jgi:RND family efflux transporter MFP subunit
MGPMNMSTATAVSGTRDLSGDVASLRIDENRRTSRRRGVRWIVAAVILTAAFGGWWWLARTRVLTVQTITVAPSAAAAADQTVLTASGYVTARRRATVSSRVTGKLSEVLVEAGVPVRQGQVLARLEDSVARAALSITDAQVTAARSELAEIEVRLREAQTNQARQHRLVEAGIVAAAEVDTINATVEALTARLAAASAAVAVAEQQLALRRVELADTTLRAPFDGVVISKDAQPGEMVSPTSAGGGFTRTGVCTIVDMFSLEIEVDVNEAHIGHIFSEQPVAVVLDAYPDQRIPGHVVATVPAADRQKATVQVRIAVEQRDPHMLPDMTVKVSFLRESEQSQSTRDIRPRLVVPHRAVRSDGGQDVVFVVRNGRAERVPVRLGAGDRDHLEIQSGLNAGDRIVVDAPGNLIDKTPVQEASVR